MPWSGGNYTKWNGSAGWTDDFNNNVGIEPGRHDTQDTDFQDGINQCLNKDGSNAATGNLDIGGNKITNMAVATTSGDAVTYGQAQAGINIQSAAPAWSVTQFSADANGGAVKIQKSRSASVGTSTIVQSGDSLGALQFLGANGTGYDVAAAISAVVDGTPGASADMPGGLVFSTTGDGSASVTERMRIRNTGFVGINETSPGVLVDASRSANDASTQIRVRNANTGSSAYSALTVGNNTNSSGGLIRLNSSANTGLGGANSLNIVQAINAPLAFCTNNAVRAKVQAAGDFEIDNKLLVNTSTELATSTQCNVKGSGATSASYTIFTQNSAATAMLSVRDDGLINGGDAALSPYNNTTGGAANCNITSGGSFARSTSSLRYKKNVTDYQKGLTELASLRPVSYQTYTDGDVQYAGFIAEEVDSAGLSEFVVYDSQNRPDALHYGNMTALLTASIQELLARVETLEARIAALEA